MVARGYLASSEALKRMVQFNLRLPGKEREDGPFLCGMKKREVILWTLRSQHPHQQNIRRWTVVCIEERE